MYKPFDLTGRCAVVTGGNGGIGYGMAEALIAAGARVAIWGSNPEKTAKAKASLSFPDWSPRSRHAHPMRSTPRPCRSRCHRYLR